MDGSDGEGAGISCTPKTAPADWSIAVSDRGQILQRLFRATAAMEAPPEMPFGFDTRVLALTREVVPNGSLIVALFARRATGIALAVIGLAVAGLYGTSVSETNSEMTNEYGIADSAIQNNLSE